MRADGPDKAAHAMGKGHCTWSSKRSHFTAIIELESRGQGSEAPVEALEQEIATLLGQHLWDHRRLLGGRDVEQRRNLSCIQRTPCFEQQTKQKNNKQQQQKTTNYLHPD